MSKWSVKGRVIEVLPIQKGQTEKGDYALQEYAIDVDDKYPYKFAFSVYGEDKIKYYNIKVGDIVEINFNVTAKKWNNKWITSVRAWKVSNLSNSYQNIETAAIQQQTEQAAQPKRSAKEYEIENLPF